MHRLLESLSVFLVAVVTIVVTSAPARAEDELAAALDAMQTYEFGESRVALTQTRTLVRAASLDVDPRAAAAADP